MKQISIWSGISIGDQWM